MSLQIDPQEMVARYGRAGPADHAGRSGSSRSAAATSSPPKYRITRSSTWEKDVNPWKDKAKLPLLEGGLLGDLIYGDEPRIIDDLVVAPDDPAAAYLDGQRSLMAVPHFDRGQRSTWSS